MSKNDEKFPAKNCKMCLFSQNVPSNVIGQWVGLCLHSPPSAIAVPMVKNGVRSLSVNPAFPPVNDTMVCAQYVEKPSEETPGA